MQHHHTSTSLETRSSTKRFIVQIVLKIFGLCILVGVYLCIVFLMNPPKRGFFCNDPTIALPYKGETITDPEMVGVSVGVGTLMLLVGELLIPYLSGCLDDKKEMKWKQQCLELFQGTCAFGVATLMSVDISELLKVSTGRLRPVFLDLCKPDYSRFNCTDERDIYKYITGDYCTNTDDAALREARVSFPSAHSMICMTCMVYTMLYMQKLRSMNSCDPIRWILHFAFVSLALLMGVSRILDHMHHVTDVFIGWALGGIIGIAAWLSVGQGRRSMQLPTTTDPQLPSYYYTNSNFTSETDFMSYGSIPASLEDEIPQTYPLMK